MSTIALTNVTKRFNDLTAVDRVNLNIDAGEVLCLLGPSGCGKTTTLRMVAGLESATEGDIHIGDEHCNHLSPSERNVAMVFQFYALYPNISVGDNLAYPLHAEKLNNKTIRDRVQTIAATLDLTDLLQRLPSQLAEGEKQRVAVGRAIIRDPSCFLFDEPLSRLDVELRQTMRGQIKEVLAELSKATVIVTHDQLEALTMADRIAVMRDGLIEQVASPHAIFAYPENIFVAGFIGTPQMNLLTATLIDHQHGAGQFQLLDQQTLQLADPAGITYQLAVGSETTLGIRPRAFTIAPEPGVDTVSGTVDIIEPMGAETLLHLLAAQQEMRVVLRRGTQVAVGDTLHLRVNPEQVHVFNHDGKLLRS